jgi:hypothetical protein
MSLLIINFKYFVLRSVRHCQMDSEEVARDLLSERDISFVRPGLVRLLIIPFHMNLPRGFAFCLSTTLRHADNGAYASIINYFFGDVIFPFSASSISPRRNESVNGIKMSSKRNLRSRASY